MTELYNQKLNRVNLFNENKMIFKGPEKGPQKNDTVSQNPDNKVFNLPGDNPDQPVANAKDLAKKMVHNHGLNEAELMKILHPDQTKALKLASKAGENLKETAFYSMSQLGQWDMLADKEYQKIKDQPKTVLAEIKDNTQIIRGMLAKNLDGTALNMIMNKIKEGIQTKLKGNNLEAGYTHASVMLKIITQMDSSNLSLQSNTASFSGDKAKNLKYIQDMLNSTSA